MTSKPRELFVTLMLFMFFGWMVISGPALAESDPWTAPVSVSSQLEGPSQFPKIVADSGGNLHVVWVENSFSERGIPDAIYYSRFDGAQWSPPVDVLVSPAQRQINLGELVMLPNDELALLWIGGDQLLLSSALSASATQPGAWSTTPVLPELSAQYAFMAFVPPTTLHIAVVDAPGYGVNFGKSDDLGYSWTEAHSVWTPLSNAYAAQDPRICVDSSGRILHLVWHENSQETGWNPDKIWYMRSRDQGTSWIDQFSLSNRGSSPNCAYDGEGNLHLLWNNAVGSPDGRYHRWSSDDGETWSDPVVIFPGLSGRTRAPAVGLDSSGALHVLTGAQAGVTTPMYWSWWTGQDWSNPIPISGDLPSNESADLVVTNGNQLQAVWHFGYEDSSDVWYSTMQTDAPAVISNTTSDQSPERALTEATSAAAVLATVETVQPDVSGQVSEMAANENTPQQQVGVFSSDSPESSLVSPVVVGALSGLLVVMGVLVIAVRRRP